MHNIFKYFHRSSITSQRTKNKFIHIIKFNFQHIFNKKRNSISPRVEYVNSSKDVACSYIMQIFSLTQSSSSTRIARIGISPFPYFSVSQALHHIKRSSRVARLKGSRLSSVFEANLNSRKASARHFEIIVSRDEKQKVIEKVSLDSSCSPNNRVILCWRDMRL
jgi:hypothetical protein